MMRVKRMAHDPRARDLRGPERRKPFERSKEKAVGTMWASKRKPEVATGLQHSM